MSLEKRLGQALVTKGIVTEMQFSEALAEEKQSGKFWGEVLVEKGYTTEAVVTQAISEQIGLAYVDLEKYVLEPSLIQLLPRESAQKYMALPLLKRATTITVAMGDPLDAAAIEQLQNILKLRVRPVLASSSTIKKRIAEAYKREPLPEFIADMEIPEVASSEESEKIASLAPVISTVDSLISKAVEYGASDIHLEPQAEHFYCRYRVDGVLQEMPRLPKKYELAIISRIKIMANMDIAEKRLPQDGRIKTEVNGKNVDLRISTFPNMHGENVVIRILDKGRALTRLEDLGMSPAMLKSFTEIINRPHGIILVTGPTGSGKTSTLYSGLTRINTVDKNIVTMEDPIEYEIERACQSQVNVRAGITFAFGLRSIVRQDPDVIMIGEIRDRETAEIAIHAALTGHLVFSTLHTNDAGAAAVRLIDMGIEPFLVSSALIGVVAQRLIRVLCPHCKEAYKPEPAVLEQLGVSRDVSGTFMREKGCGKCRNTGYSGRMGIFEIFLPTDELKKLIDKKVPASELKQAAIRLGMKTLRQDGIEKFKQGLTSLAEVLRVTQHD